MSSALSIRQLTKTYGNGFQALKGIDLDSLTLEQIIKQALKKMMKG